MKSIDLNCDLGEGMAGEEAIAPWISSANISCGGHAGTSEGISQTIVIARRHGVAIGAHPGFEDKEHFGRNPVVLPPGGYQALVERQLGDFMELATRHGVRAFSHVKPHGALYHMAAGERWIADEICEVLLTFDPRPALVGPGGSAMEASAVAHGLTFLTEGFCDRLVMEDGRLAPRTRPDAVIVDPEAAARQALRLATRPDPPRTICLHGDNPAAPAIARAVHRALEAAGFPIRHPF
jgi:5-oxoprolinase (ATP-hydrolysing) subunit A